MLRRDEALAIVREVFAAAGWTDQERPTIDDRGDLNDGNHWEPARLDSEDALREQCREWAKA